MGGRTDLFASIVAPNADIVITGDEDFYGALIGRTVTVVGDHYFHADESSPAYSMIAPPAPALVR